MCCGLQPYLIIIFFFNDTATTEIYTLSLHDALPISVRQGARHAFHDTLRGLLRRAAPLDPAGRPRHRRSGGRPGRSEEHTSELQSRQYFVCRLLLEYNNILCDSLLYPFPTISTFD